VGVRHLRLENDIGDCLGPVQPSSAVDAARGLAIDSPDNRVWLGGPILSHRTTCSRPRRAGAPVSPREQARGGDGLLSIVPGPATLVDAAALFAGSRMIRARFRKTADLFQRLRFTGRRAVG
jgi:hypothetical protein